MVSFQGRRALTVNLNMSHSSHQCSTAPFPTSISFCVSSQGWGLKTNREQWQRAPLVWPGARLSPFPPWPKHLSADATGRFSSLRPPRPTLSLPRQQSQSWQDTFILGAVFLVRLFLCWRCYGCAFSLEALPEALPLFAYIRRLLLICSY